VFDLRADRTLERSRLRENRPDVICPWAREQMSVCQSSVNSPITFKMLKAAKSFQKVTFVSQVSTSQKSSDPKRTNLVGGKALEKKLALRSDCGSCWRQRDHLSKKKKCPVAGITELKCYFHIPKDAREAQTGRLFPNPTTKGEKMSMSARARFIKRKKIASQMQYSQGVICVGMRTRADELSEGASHHPQLQSVG